MKIACTKSSTNSLRPAAKPLDLRLLWRPGGHADLSTQAGRLDFAAILEDMCDAEKFSAHVNLVLLGVVEGVRACALSDPSGDVEFI